MLQQIIILLLGLLSQLTPLEIKGDAFLFSSEKERIGLENQNAKGAKELKSVNVWEKLSQAGVTDLGSKVDEIKSIANKYLDDLPNTNIADEIAQAGSYRKWYDTKVLGKADDWFESLPTALKKNISEDSKIKKLFESATDIERERLIKSWKVLESNEIVRKSFYDLEIVDLYIKKYPDQATDILNKFKSASSPIEERRLLTQWEEAISPPQKYPKGKVSQANTSEFLKTEVKQTSEEISSIRQYKQMIEDAGGVYNGPPIQVFEYRGRLIVVDGHHRLAAAQAAGLKEIPFIHLTDTQFNEAIKAMKREGQSRFSTRLTGYRHARSLENTPNVLPSDLMPK